MRLFSRFHLFAFMLLVMDRDDVMFDFEAGKTTGTGITYGLVAREA